MLSQNLESIQENDKILEKKENEYSKNRKLKEL